MRLAAPPRPATLTADELADRRAYVEAIIGRPLRQAEQAIDVLRLDEALNAAKDELTQAIRQEIRRAAKRALPVELPIRLEVTRAMLRPLERLVEIGYEEAVAELERAGYVGVTAPPKRSLEDAAPRFDALWLLREELRDMLGPLAVRVNQGAVEASLGELSAEMLARALMRTPGGRNIASQLVSRALVSGMEPVFEANDDLVGGWAYSAVLDSALCSRCAPLDGKRYPSWQAVQADLPGGGPNPYCLGRGRCRCRAAPLGGRA